MMPHPYLAAIREAHVERVRAAYEQVLRSGAFDEGYGLPGNLIAAGCWLVHHGWDGDASPAEKAAGWGPRRYRLYLDTLDAEGLAAEIEDGRRALFEGRHPIFVSERRAA